MHAFGQQTKKIKDYSEYKNKKQISPKYKSQNTNVHYSTLYPE